ncbi:MAG TPA: NAD(P)H-hydrate dehydratase [Lachnospiraceae bacterium]|nr:NAD(P)H-hydrate dehydratase [Lachnospiraceae bacterium]
MEYLVTGNEMHAYDTYTIEQIGIPALVLMERAALKVAEYIEKKFSENSNVLCVCGTGNNGGDGFCVARLLIDRGMNVDTVLVGDDTKATNETKIQLDILKQYGVFPYDKIPNEEYDVIIDAFFGIGLKRELVGKHKDVINEINTLSGVKISIDIPSGINVDSGQSMGTAVKADVTITLAFRKRGLYLYPGSDFAGNIELVDIGISTRSFVNQMPGMYTIMKNAKSYFPERKKDGNKGTFGKVLLVAGSADMAGAAILAGRSAYKSGAGMVKLIIPETIRVIIQESLPDAMIQTYCGVQNLSEEEKNEFIKNMDWADTVAIGPGLSISEIGKEFLNLAITYDDKPLVIDADGINMLAIEPKLLETLVNQIENRHKPVILTPHMGELARLLKKKINEVVQDETGNTISAAELTHCIVVGKSARTHVYQQGNPIFLNTAGNNKMATAGSGDVLTGIIASFLAQGLTPFQAAESGVYIHACAGDAAAHHAGSAALTASDIIAGLSYL